MKRNFGKPISKTKKSFFKKIFEDPLLRPIEVFGTILGLFLVSYSFFESNRLTWLNSINATSIELSKMEINNDFITCLYKSEISDITKDKYTIEDVCNEKVYKNLNIKKATLYLEENLDFFLDIIKYDEKYWWKNENEFMLHYLEWYYDLHGTDNEITRQFQTKHMEIKVNKINKYIEQHSN